MVCAIRRSLLFGCFVDSFCAVHSSGFRSTCRGESGLFLGSQALKSRRRRRRGDYRDRNNTTDSSAILLSLRNRISTGSHHHRLTPGVHDIMLAEFRSTWSRFEHNSKWDGMISIQLKIVLMSTTAPCIAVAGLASIRTSLQ